MKYAIKQALKRNSVTTLLYTKWQAFQHVKEAKRLFVNYDTYLDALHQKHTGTIFLNTRDGLSIEIRRNLFDARIVKETFFYKPYIRYFSLPTNPIVVDVGGYIGDFSLYAAHYLKASRVVVYEPTAENFMLLKRNLHSNGFENKVTAVNKAVSNTSEVELMVQIDEHEEVHASAYWYEQAQKRVVESNTLEQLMKIHSLNSVDLLKVDCEGGEYDIFPSLSDETLRCIKNIVFEHHKVKRSDVGLETILDRLQSAGYSLKLDEEIAYAYRE